MSLYWGKPSTIWRAVALWGKEMMAGGEKWLEFFRETDQMNFWKNAFAAIAEFISAILCVYLFLTSEQFWRAWPSIERLFFLIQQYSYFTFL